MDQGIKLTRVKYWPDYYDELPGARCPAAPSLPSCSTSNELGAWKQKLRPSFIVAPA